MTTQTLDFTAPADPETAKATVLLDVRIQKPGKSRKADIGKVETTDDKTMLRLSKQLLDAPELRAVEKQDNEFRAWLYTQAVPGAPFRSGIHVIPAALIEDVDARITRYADRRSRLVEAFLLAYPQRIEDARQRLGSQWKATDYPPAENMRAAFSVSYQYLTFETPAVLAGLNRELWQREKDKARDMWAEAQDEMRAAMRQAFGEIVSHMADRLTPGDDGKPKVFRDSLIGNFREFLQTFPARDITNDQELAALVDRARALLSGIDADDLRKADGLRSSVAANIASIKADLDNAITTGSARARKFRL